MRMKSITKEELLNFYLKCDGDINKISKILFERNIKVTYFSILRRIKKDKIFEIPEALKLFHKKNGGRNPGQRRKYNENFFDTWNHVSAYIFGVIAGDGSIHNVENKIRFSAGLEDQEFLEMIKKVVESDAKLSSHKKKDKNGKIIGQCLSLAVSSKKWKDRLLELGLNINKNKNSFTLSKCPYEFQGDMLRGLYDTDGSLAKFNVINGVRPRSISWSSKHKEVVEEIEKMLKIRNIEKIRIDTNNKNVYSIHCGDLDKLVPFLYQNADSLYMKRKRPDSYDQYKGTLDIFNQKRN